MEFAVDMRMPFSQAALRWMPFHWFAPADAPLELVAAYSAHFNMVDAVARFGAQLVLVAETDLARWGFDTLAMKRAAYTDLHAECAAAEAEQDALHEQYAALARQIARCRTLAYGIEVAVAAHDRAEIAQTIKRRTGIDGAPHGSFSLWFPTRDPRLTFCVSCRYGQVIVCLIQDEQFIAEELSTGSEADALALVDVHVVRDPAYIDLAAAPFLRRK